MKKVKLPKSSFWTQKAVDELLKFPNSRHDDFVDTIAWVGMGLSRLATPGGMVAKQDMTPKVGTLAWVKWDASQRDKQERLLSATGGF